MAYTSGTAANYKDLLAILATFAAANGWSILRQTTEELYLRGAGDDGLDEIYCGVRCFENTSAGYYNWELYGAIAYRADRNIGDQPFGSNGVAGSGAPVFSCFWNAAIPYWMVATPRRIIVFAKVNTIYSCVHLGFIDPPATPSQYPYPLLIGGSNGVVDNSYASTAYSHTAFWSWSGSSSPTIFFGTVYLPSGEWGVISNVSSSNSTVLRVESLCNPWRGSLLKAPDDSYLLEPMFIRRYNFQDVLGQINGIYWVSGYQNASENIITVDGVNYMVFQDTFRTSYGDYCAMRMS